MKKKKIKKILHTISFEYTQLHKKLHFSNRTFIHKWFPLVFLIYASHKFFWLINKNSIEKHQKGVHQSTYDVYHGPKSTKKKERENKKLLPPSNWTQPINEIK